MRGHAPHVHFSKNVQVCVIRISSLFKLVNAFVVFCKTFIDLRAYKVSKTVYVFGETRFVVILHGVTTCAADNTSS